MLDERERETPAAAADWEGGVAGSKTTRVGGSLGVEARAAMRGSVADWFLKCCCCWSMEE
jgi:hypothetical protein